MFVYFSLLFVYLVLPLLGSDVQRRVQVLGGGVDLGAALQQEHHNVHVAQAGGDVQGSLLLLEKKNQCNISFVVDVTRHGLKYIFALLVIFAVIGRLSTDTTSFKFLECQLPKDTLTRSLN